MQLNNQIILITGASSGIGHATALALSKMNNALILTARREKLLQEVAEQIRANGSTCDYFVGDASEEAHAEEVVSEIIQ